MTTEVPSNMTTEVTSNITTAPLTTALPTTNITEASTSPSSAYQTTTTGPVKFKAITCADKSWQPVVENQEKCKDVEGFPTIKMYFMNFLFFKNWPCIFVK